MGRSLPVLGMRLLSSCTQMMATPQALTIQPRTSDSSLDRPLLLRRLPNRAQLCYSASELSVCDWLPKVSCVVNKICFVADSAAETPAGVVAVAVHVGAYGRMKE